MKCPIKREQMKRFLMCFFLIHFCVYSAWGFVKEGGHCNESIVAFMCDPGLFCNENGICERSAGCSNGFTSIEAKNIIVASTCPFWTQPIGEAVSCEETDYSENCIRFAPPGMLFEDKSGTYGFVEACPLSE